MQRSAPSDRSPRSVWTRRLNLEPLEGRLTPSGQGVQLLSGVVAGGPGYSPAQIRHAYGFDQLPASDTGSGVTVAVVLPYGSSTLVSDVNTFNTAYGLPLVDSAGGPTLSVVNQTGGAQVPAGTDAGWSLEAALDTEWLHAVAPQANILFVVASSANDSDVFAAVDYASAHAQVVSMSFGGGEMPLEGSLDSHFDKPGVAFVAAAGDQGTGASYPAASPYVLAVGGTRLSLDSAGNRIAETGWSGSGGGVSTAEAMPGYQSALVPSTGGLRGTPDVSYAADPSLGFSVYSAANGGWALVGGTSAGAPQWAGLIALADQQRLAAGRPVLSTSSATSSPFYSAAAPGAYASNYFDVTAGSNGSGGSTTRAGTGYDFVNGLGSPRANNLVPFLAGDAPATAPAPVTAPPPGGSVPSDPGGSATTGTGVAVGTGSSSPAPNAGGSSMTSTAPGTGSGAGSATGSGGTTGAAPSAPSAPTGGTSVTPTPVDVGSGSSAPAGSGVSNPSPSADALRQQNAQLIQAIVGLLAGPQARASGIQLLTLLDFNGDNYLDVALVVGRGRNQVVVVLNGLTGGLLFDSLTGPHAG